MKYEQAYEGQKIRYLNENAPNLHRAKGIITSFTNQHPWIEVIDNEGMERSGTCDWKNIEPYKNKPIMIV
jgi:hypothetical protein